MLAFLWGFKKYFHGLNAAARPNELPEGHFIDAEIILLFVSQLDTIVSNRIKFNFCFKL